MLDNDQLFVQPTHLPQSVVLKVHVRLDNKPEVNDGPKGNDYDNVSSPKWG